MNHAFMLHSLGMKLAILTATLLAASGAMFAADPAMTKEERDKALAAFRESRDQFLRSIADVNDAQWVWKPAPERWSVGLTAEHLVRAEELLFRSVETAMKSEPNPDWEKKTAGKIEFLEKIMPTRTGKAQAPFEIVPEGKISRMEILDRFDKIRVRALAFTNDVSGPVKNHTVEHPFAIFNTLNAYQWLMYMPWHTERHVKQIMEVKSSPGYPK